MNDCINLRERFGDKYRVTYEESYYAEHGDHGRADDPWLLQLECENGTIYPYGGNELVASTRRRGPVANRLAALACVTVWRDASDGIDVRIDVANFDKVAAVMKPRRKRQVSDAERARLAEMSARHSPFRKPPISQPSGSELESLPSDLDDSEHQPAASRRSSARESDLSGGRMTRPARVGRTGGKPASSSRDGQRRESA